MTGMEVYSALEQFVVVILEGSVRGIGISNVSMLVLISVLSVCMCVGLVMVYGGGKWAPGIDYMRSKRGKYMNQWSGSRRCFSTVSNRVKCIVITRVYRPSKDLINYVVCATIGYKNDPGGPKVDVELKHEIDEDKGVVVVTLLREDVDRELSPEELALYEERDWYTQRLYDLFCGLYHGGYDMRFILKARRFKDTKDGGLIKDFTTRTKGRYKTVIVHKEALTTVEGVSAWNRSVIIPFSIQRVKTRSGEIGPRKDLHVRKLDHIFNSFGGITRRRYEPRRGIVLKGGGVW